jgi:multidrug transporter EmrE-like cation transporter
LRLIQAELAHPPFTKLTPIRFQELSEAVAGFERTGVPLVSVRGDSLIPTAGYTDDVGMYYLAMKLASLFHLSAAAAWDLFFFLIIIPCFAIGFVGMMKVMKTTVAKVFYAVMSSLLFVTVYLSGDIYALSPSLAVAVIPYMVQFTQSETRPSIKHWVVFLMFGMVIMLAHLIRAHSATAIVLTFCSLFFFEKRWQAREKWISLALITVGIVLVSLFFKTRYAERDAYLSQRQPNYVAPPQTHPFWHNVYIGFGFLEGIRYKHVAMKNDVD